MTGEQARLAITNKFLAGWAAAHPTVEIFAEGVKEPDLTKQKTAFVMFKVCLPRVSQGELAQNPFRRYTGLVEIGLFVPKGKGTKPFFDMSDSIVSILAVQVISGVRMQGVTAIERQPAVGWQSREVLVNYSFDSIN